MVKSRRKPVDPNATGVDAIKAVMTLRELSEKVGMSYIGVKRWKQAGIPLTRLDEVHQITGISTDVLRPDTKGKVV